ncbi:uncharacterized protein LOC122868747 [Siniperca chuatsi]|uniref:uncharacterized protein LOC122868747 n=1 Tax=Siniperca chuatsi TaxID=119488 RepID=UPI001CE146A9|nr:uncharacterized protein LOC122868747 [Siniperca chuatsi]
MILLSVRVRRKSYHIYRYIDLKQLVANSVKLPLRANMSIDRTKLLFEGFLQKRKDTMKIRWVTYWFRLQNTTLFFYTKKNGSASHLRGYYYIYTVQSVREVQRSDSKRIMFEIIMTNGKRKVLAAETAALRKEWVGHLWQAMHLSASGVSDSKNIHFEMCEQRERINSSAPNSSHSDSLMELLPARPHSAPGPTGQMHHAISACGPTGQMHHAISASGPTGQMHHAISASGPTGHMHHAISASGPTGHMHHAISASGPTGHMHHAISAPGPTVHMQHEIRSIAPPICLSEELNSKGTTYQNTPPPCNYQHHSGDSLNSPQWSSRLSNAKGSGEGDYDILPLRKKICESNASTEMDEDVYDFPVSYRRVSQPPDPTESIYDVPSSLLRKISDHTEEQMEDRPLEDMRSSLRTKVIDWRVAAVPF